MLEAYYHPDHIGCLLVRIKMEDYDHFIPKAEEYGMSPLEFMVKILTECEDELSTNEVKLRELHQDIFGVPYGQEPSADIDSDELEWMEEQFEEECFLYDNVVFPVPIQWWDVTSELLEGRGWHGSLSSSEFCGKPA